MAIRLSIRPFRALVDVPLTISVLGLEGSQKVTLRSRTVSESGFSYFCIAHYVARKDGSLDLSKDASIGGYYKGVEPMGLVWAQRISSTRKHKFARLEKKDVTKPFILEISVFDSHIGSIESTRHLTALAFGEAERWYMKNDVERIPVNTEGIKGTMFLPKKNGKSPGVLDLFGGRPGVTEFRAALLASHGYATLTVGYWYGNTDFSSDNTLDLGCFEKAIAVLSSHERVAGDGVAVVGTSLGGTISLFLGAYFKGVKCAVSINGPLYPFVTDFVWCGRRWKGFFPDQCKMTTIDDAVDASQGLPELSEVEMGTSIPEFHKSSIPFLFIAGDDDCIIRWEENAPYIDKALKSQEKTNCLIMQNPGAGHLIHPPYCAFSWASYIAKDRAQVWGGNAKDHAKAEERSWKAVLDFLKINL